MHYNNEWFTGCCAKALADGTCCGAVHHLNAHPPTAVARISDWFKCWGDCLMVLLALTSRCVMSLLHCCSCNQHACCMNFKWCMVDSNNRHWSMWLLHLVRCEHCSAAAQAVHDTPLQATWLDLLHTIVSQFPAQAPALAACLPIQPASAAAEAPLIACWRQVGQWLGSPELSSIIGQHVLLAEPALQPPPALKRAMSGAEGEGGPVSPAKKRMRKLKQATFAGMSCWLWGRGSKVHWYL